MKCIGILHSQYLLCNVDKNINEVHLTTKRLEVHKVHTVTVLIDLMGGQDGLSEVF